MGAHGRVPGPLVACRGGRTNSTGARSPLTLRSAGWVGGARPSSLLWWGGVGACCRGLGLRALCVLLLLPSSCCAAAGVFWWWCGGLWGCGWVGCELYSGREYLCSLWCVFVVCLAPGSCCAVRGVVGSGAWFLPVLCVVFMGVRWMPWHQGPMKDVVDCDKPRGAVLRALIRGFPNGGTRRPSRGVTRV